MGLWIAAYFVTNGLNNWMPSLYKTVYGMGLQESLRASSLTNVAQVITLLGCALLIDRIGRKAWLVTVFTVGGVLLVILGAGAASDATNVIVLITLSYGIIGSANAVLYLYTPEIYPTRMRAIGTGLATSWLRLASAAAPAIVGLILRASGTAAMFLMFAAVSFAGGLIALRMIATQQRQLEEISP